MKALALIALIAVISSAAIPGAAFAVCHQELHDYHDALIERNNVCGHSPNSYDCGVAGYTAWWTAIELHACLSRVL